MDDFATALDKLGVKWSMEVIDKTTCCLIDIGEVAYFFVRYTIADSQGETKTFEAYTWCPEATALSYAQELAPVDAKTVLVDETVAMASLSILKEGEKIGTTDSKDIIGVRK